jgi:hypothetical protein
MSEEIKSFAEKIKEVGENNNKVINQLAEDLSSYKGKTQKLEEELHLMKCKEGTRGIGMGVPQDGSITGAIGQALNENLTGLGQLYTGQVKQLRIETKAVADMGITTNLTGGTSSISSPVIGPLGMSYRWNNVQDMLRQTTMTGMYLPLLKDNGGEGTVTPVAEGATKPQVDFDLAEATAKAEVIAATTTVSKQFFEDVQNASNWLRDRLTELWQSAFNDQLLNGSGTSPNLKGLNTAGNFTAASGAATVDVEQLVQGILQMRILKRRPSGIIINPASLESLILNKAVGSGEYDVPAVMTISPNGQLMFMGVPVVDVAEQPSGTFTIHDNSGSLLAWRQMLTIEIFDQPLATTNKLLIRIEARVAFPNFGASYTVKGTL